MALINQDKCPASLGCPEMASTEIKPYVINKMMITKSSGGAYRQNQTQSHHSETHKLRWYSPSHHHQVIWRQPPASMMIAKSSGKLIIMNKHHQVTQAHQLQKEEQQFFQPWSTNCANNLFKQERQHYRYFNTHLPATNHRVLPLETEGRYPCI